MKQQLAIAIVLCDESPIWIKLKYGNLKIWKYE